jgi:hypothetical protein
MIMSVLVLVVSTALFFFYIQTVCEKALRREFNQAYFQDVIKAIQLEFPHLCNSFDSNAFYNYSDACLALKCDFMTLEYLLKNGDPSRRHLSRHEMVLVLYFRFLLLCLPIRHAFRFHEKETVLRMANILQFFANLVGEKLSFNSFTAAPSRF